MSLVRVSYRGIEEVNVNVSANLFVSFNSNVSVFRLVPVLSPFLISLEQLSRSLCLTYALTLRKEIEVFHGVTRSVFPPDTSLKFECVDVFLSEVMPRLFLGPCWYRPYFCVLTFSEFVDLHNEGTITLPNSLQMNSIIPYHLEPRVATLGTFHPCGFVTVVS